MMIDKRILVVEDDPDGQEVVGRILRHHRVAHDIANSGEDALQYLASTQYNGLVVDLALPGMDGWTLLNHVQTNPATASVPCVAITAFHSAEVAIHAIEAGFAAYFPKPLEPTAFVRELERIF